MTPGDLRSGTEGGAGFLDFSRASLARLTDALLGGHDHYEVDRDAMRRLMAIAPGAKAMARELSKVGGSTSRAALRLARPR